LFDVKAAVAVSDVPIITKDRMSSLPQLPDSSCGTGPGSVPVFNCIVLFRRDGDRLLGRVANLPGLTAENCSERDLLKCLAARFREVVQDSVRLNRAIPWLDPPQAPGPGEQQRFIAVHL
jgi:hypothetical protein